MSDIVQYLRGIILGYLVAESAVFGWHYGSHISVESREEGLQWLALLVMAVAVIVVAVRFVKTDTSFLVRAYAPKLVHFVPLLGVALTSLFPDALAATYISIVDGMSLTQTTGLMLVPLVYLLLSTQGDYGSTDKRSLFVSDAPIHGSSDDELDMKVRANFFADRLFDDGARESLAFGLDAPWGSGKTSFINLCKERWRENMASEVIVYEFSPIDYPKNTSLIDHFVDGLIAAIQREVYAPELNGMASQYLRSLDSIGSYSFFGIDIPLPRMGTNENVIFSSVERLLYSSGRKVIAVVEDLDRIHFDEAKQLLFLIRKGFALRGINFLLVYDSEVLSTQQTDTGAKDVAIYLEKFVNVKASIYPDSSRLHQYLSEVLPEHFVGTTVDQARIRALLKGVVSIIESEEFWRFQRYFSDIRKYKRLVNTIVLAGLHEVDLEELDIDAYDLTLLLIIYVYYPATFRDIYNTETNGKSGFFSLVVNYGDDGKYANSEYYREYIEKCQDDPKRLLLESLFDVTRVDGKDDVFQEDLTEENRSRMACFNHPYHGRNLETYLEIIVGLNTPRKEDQYLFYAARYAEFRKGVALQEVFRRSEFSAENVHKRFWDHLCERIRELEDHEARAVLDSALEQLPRYSMLIEPERGLRNNVPIYLTRIINDYGGRRFDRDSSAEDRYGEIRDIVYGNEGVLDKLYAGAEVLSFNDMLMFKLYCSANRGGELHNLTAALARKPNGEYMRQGVVKEIAILGLRELAQTIYEKFVTCFIQPKRSIVKEIFALNVSQLAGQYEASKADSSHFESRKNHLVSFMLYQLASESTELGVACGYYDPRGSEDGRGIRRAMNDYLFNVCFDANSSDCIDDFTVYLMTQYVQDTYSGERVIPRFDQALDPKMLKQYWNANGDAIHRSIEVLSEKGRQVVLGEDVLNVADYREKLPADIESVLAQL